MSPRRRRRAVVAVALLALLALAPAACATLDDAFTCTAAAECVDEGAPGTCEPTGFCSFADATCAGVGRRYGEYAGGGLGATCVGDAGDGGAGDGGVDNLLANPGCETDTVGWTTNNAVLTRSNLAHAGSGSCQVCGVAGASDFSLDDDNRTDEFVVESPRQGETYHAGAWVRAAPGIAGQYARITLREWDGPDSSTAQRGVSEPLLIDDTWRFIEVTHVVVTDAYALDVFVANDEALDGDCFLVDDVTVNGPL